MKRLIIVVAIVLFAIAPSAGAAESDFLPNCDQTLYDTSSRKGILAKDYTPDLGQIEKVYTSTACRLEDFVQLFINLADWGMTIIAVVTLFFFAWGAWQWIIAGGRTGMIDDGKKKMTGAITGLLIVLIAWVLVGFYIGALTGNFKGYVFPGSDSQRLWFGDRSSCKNTYTTLCRAGTDEVIKNGCGDPATTEFGDIAQIQKRLADHKCEVGGTDGCYGPKTEAAVKSFQESNLLPTTGEVDLTTYNALMVGGFPCGFDGFIPTPGCCLPTNVVPSTKEQYCIQNIIQSTCESTEYGNPPIKYYFQGGNCPASLCGTVQGGTIKDLGDIKPF